MDQETQIARYQADMAGRPAAHSPASFGEIWNAEWTRGGLDTPLGQRQYIAQAHDDLVQAIEGASGMPLPELARSHGVSIGGSLDGRIAQLDKLVDVLPEDQRERVAIFRDVRGRAADRAQAAERQADEVANRTYGLTGAAVGFLAGTARQMSDPVVLGANVATGGIGGAVFKGGLLKVVGRQALAGVAAQALIEPVVQSGRAELGLEHGWGRAAENILEAGIGSAGITVALRAGAAGVRAARRRLFGEAGETAGGIAPGGPDTPTLADPTGSRGEADILRARLAGLLEPEDFEAASRLTARDEVINGRARNPHLDPAEVEAAEQAINRGEPVDRASAALGGLELEGGGAAARQRRLDPNRFAPTDGTEQQFIIRPNGARLAVDERVVEARDLVVSHDIDGRKNAHYPAELQPRSREEGASRVFVAERAPVLEPELLGSSPTAATGAPVVRSDGVVVSGNARAMMIARAYDRHPERGDAYRQFLRDQGHNIDGFEFPVLVRVIKEEPGAGFDFAAFAREANVAPTANLSIRDRAFADAKNLDANLLASYRGGEAHKGQNAIFVRGFIERVVAAEEQPDFLSGGRLSANGQQRVEAALVAKGWGAEDVVRALYEAAEPTSKAILGALSETAPLAARLRSAIEEGRTPAALDPTPAILEAFRLVDRARARGLRVGDLIAQVDIEHGVVPAQVAEAAKLFFRDAELTQAASRDAIASRIEAAISRVLDQQNAVGDLFGASFDAGDALRAAALAGTPLDDLPLHGQGNAPPTPPPKPENEARLPGEPDKLYAKRVIDHRPVPLILPEDHQLYFPKITDETERAPLSKLVSSKPPEANVESGANAAKRMQASADGELSGRGAIWVTPLPDGRYLVADGNGTLAAVTKYGWKEMPVKVAPVLFEHDATTGVVRMQEVIAGHVAAGMTPKLAKEFYKASRKGLTWRQPFNTLEEAIAIAPEHQVKMVQAISDIIQDIGVNRLKNPGVKKDVERMKQKIVEKYDGSPRGLGDVVRAGMLVDSPAMSDRVVEELGKKFRIIDEGWVKNDVGYFDRKLDIVFEDGVVAEFQFWNQPIYDVKGYGHELYEIRRLLDPEVPEQKKLIPVMMEIERAHYAKAHALMGPEWAELTGGPPADIKRSPYASSTVASSVGEPSLQTSAAETGTQLLPESEKAVPLAATKAIVSPQEYQPDLYGVSSAGSDINTSIKNIVSLPPKSKAEAAAHAALVQEAERVLGDIGDFEIQLPGPDGGTRRLRATDALRESEEATTAANELAACIAEAAE